MGKMTKIVSYSTDFITPPSNSASDYDIDDYSYRLLAPTMTTLLQQQARGISSGSS